VTNMLPVPMPRTNTGGFPARPFQRDQTTLNDRRSHIRKSSNEPVASSGLRTHNSGNNPSTQPLSTSSATGSEFTPSRFSLQ